MKLLINRHYRASANEFEHLLNKLKFREEDKFRKLKHIDAPETHPLFRVVDGEVEEWEIINNKG